MILGLIVLLDFLFSPLSWQVRFWEKEKDGTIRCWDPYKVAHTQPLVALSRLCCLEGLEDSTFQF